MFMRCWKRLEVSCLGCNSILYVSGMNRRRATWDCATQVRRSWRSPLAVWPTHEWNVGEEETSDMRGILVMVGGSVGGWIAWALVERWGFMTAFFVSLVGTAVGVYAANRLARHYLP
jgi:hypothetical protein